jgi:chromosomal replication initiator protein
MADSANEVRNAVVAHVRRNHPDLCRHWFDDIRAIDFDNGTLRLTVGERVRLRYLANECVNQFTEATQAVTGRLVAVVFVDENEIRPGATGRVRRSAGAGGTPNGHGPAAAEPAAELVLKPDFTFESFVPGPANRLARAAALAVADRPGEAYNPLFIYGGVGLGKTHLLHAICQHVLARDPKARIHYVSCDSFRSDFQHAVREGEMLDFRDRYRSVDLLVIDDIHFLSRLEQSQEEFFHTFNTLHQAGRQIILSSDAAPDDIPELEERLVSRFNSGLVALVEKPDYETRMAILKVKAGLRQMDLPDDVASYIAAAIDTNIRDLEGAISSLLILASMNDKPVDVALAMQALGSRGQKTASDGNQPSVLDIIEVVCDFYDVKRADLLSRKKTKSIAQPRQVCMWLARRHTRCSLEEIGGYLGGRDHTTVLHAIKMVEKKCESDERTAKDVAYIERRVLDRTA